MWCFEWLNLSNLVPSESVHCFFLLGDVGVLNHIRSKILCPHALENKKPHHHGDALRAHPANMPEDAGCRGILSLFVWNISFLSLNVCGTEAKENAQPNQELRLPNCFSKEENNPENTQPQRRHSQKMMHPANAQLLHAQRTHSQKMINPTNGQL